MIKRVPRVFSFPYRRHIGKREDPGDEVGQITLLAEPTFFVSFVYGSPNLVVTRKKIRSCVLTLLYRFVKLKHNISS